MGDNPNGVANSRPAGRSAKANRTCLCAPRVLQTQVIAPTLGMSRKLGEDDFLNH